MHPNIIFKREKKKISHLWSTIRLCKATMWILFCRFTDHQQKHSVIALSWHSYVQLHWDEQDWSFVPLRSNLSVFEWHFIWCAETCFFPHQTRCPPTSSSVLLTPWPCWMHCPSVNEHKDVTSHYLPSHLSWTAHLFIKRSLWHPGHSIESQH